MTKTPLEITQADRDAAIRFWNDDWSDDANSWRNLSSDEQDAIVQAFARHRIQALEKAAEVAESFSSGEPWARFMRDTIAAAIRALASEETGNVG